MNEIQIIELEMLCYIDKICRENEIPYSIASGTMLGAVRHKGFIPWDDDIDVYMSAKSFKKFQKVCHSDEYFLQTPNSDIQSPYVMYKLRKNGTRLPERQYSRLNIHQGIWVDIFIYVNGAESRLGRKMQFLFEDLLATFRCRYLNADRRIIHRLLTMLPVPIALIIDRSILEIINLIGKKNSAVYFAIDIDENRHFPRKLFDNLKEYQFENMKCYGIKEFDEYLRLLYGNDFMTPKRWGHNIDNSGIVVK